MVSIHVRASVLVRLTEVTTQVRVSFWFSLQKYEVRRLQPATLELFFIDGKPDGMLTAEVFGWTGHLLMAPRLRLADALKRRKLTLPVSTCCLARLTASQQPT